MIDQILDLLASLFKWWVVVTPWEQGVRVRWGRHKELLEPGVHLKVPLMHQIYKQSVRRRFSAVPAQTLTMHDGRTLTVAGALGYVITDIERLYDTLHHAEATLESETQGLVTDYIVSTPSPTLEGLKAHVESHLNFERYGITEPEFIINTFAIARTYRLIQGEPRDWTSGESLNTRLTAEQLEYD